MQQSWWSPNVFGLYELSSDGTILYTWPRTEEELSAPEHAIVDRDFFRDVFGCENIDDLRRHFRRFITGDEPVDAFNFDCRFEQRTVRTSEYLHDSRV